MTAFFSVPFPSTQCKKRFPRLPIRSCSVPRCTLEYDTILIGTGLSTLSTAALLHLYSPNHKSLLLEAHTTPGGAAHSFVRKCGSGKLTFESGPHLFSGLQPGDNNPVGQLFKALDIHPPLIGYDSWGVLLGDRCVVTKVPGTVLMEEMLSAQGREEMKFLTEALRPYGEAAKALSVACVRPDVGMIRVLLARFPRLVKYTGYFGDLSSPFESFLKRYVNDRLTYQLVNLLCFLLAGVKADKIPLAEVAFMFSEWMTGAGLQRPVGGGMGIVNELLKYIRARKGVVRTGCTVENLLIEDGRATGVRLQNGEVIKAKRVVSGVSCLDLDRMIGRKVDRDVCESFMHLHIGIRLDALKIQGKLEANYVVVDDIYGDLEAAGNVVLVSIPSVIDKSVAPEGWAVLHAYTPATEPWDAWEGLQEGSDEYERYKDERSVPLWNAVNKIFGTDVRPHAEVALVGTPKTHKRYLRRERGSYGGMVDAGKGLTMGLDTGWGSGVDGLLVVGDGVFPGVGVPAVVGSAWVAANSCVDVRTHEQLLKSIGV